RAGIGVRGTDIGGERPAPANRLRRRWAIGQGNLAEQEIATRVPAGTQSGQRRVRKHFEAQRAELYVYSCTQYITIAIRVGTGCQDRAVGKSAQGRSAFRLHRTHIERLPVRGFGEQEVDEPEESALIVWRRFVMRLDERQGFGSGCLGFLLL